MNSYNVRYINNYKIALAIILPTLLTIYPFILLMQQFPKLDALQSYLIIFLFLGAVILLTFWLIKALNPKVNVIISETEIKIQFPRNNLFYPSNFTFKTTEICSFSYVNSFDFKSLKNGSPYKNHLYGDYYLLIKTNVKPRKLQFSAITYDFEDQRNIENVAKQLSKIIKIKR
ncbi:hypothetical protein [Polaribacter sp.]|uniref:hypothetical protein n=1 Tax=Polaribacter sp. TaxID=1920175 RepID=UPI004047D64C